MQSRIWQLQLMLTERCCIHCPDCALDIPRISNPLDMSMETICEIAKEAQELEQIHITGGEPLIHTEFDKISYQLRQLFNPKQLWLATNAVLIKDHIDAVNQYDHVVATHYCNNTYSASNSGFKYDNSKQIDFLKYNYTGSLLVNYGVHHLRSRRSNEKSCTKANNGVVIVYPDKMLYPCCIGRGKPNATGIQFDKEWKTKITKLPINCEECFFAGF